MVVFQLTIAPAPATVARDFDPIVNIVKIIFPDQITNLGISNPGTEDH